MRPSGSIYLYLLALDGKTINEGQFFDTLLCVSPRACLIAPPEEWPEIPEGGGGHRAPSASEILAGHNAIRDSLGLTTLSLDSRLTTAITLHLQWLDDNDVLSHTGQNGSTPSERATAAGYAWSLCGENLSAGRQNVDDAMTGWMNSPPHHANIVNGGYRHIGAAAISSEKWGLIFGVLFGAP
ncbi:MAG: CAP domain-containing protein [Chromatiales bacterium]|nr:CAP domain-containing protein [Chromatiales bacterium]